MGLECVMSCATWDARQLYSGTESDLILEYPACSGSASEQLCHRWRSDFFKAPKSMPRWHHAANGAVAQPSDSEYPSNLR